MSDDPNDSDEIDLYDIEETHALLSQEYRWLTDAEFGGFINMVRMAQEHQTKSALNTRETDRNVEFNDNNFGVKIHTSILVWQSIQPEEFPEQEDKPKDDKDKRNKRNKRKRKIKLKIKLKSNQKIKH